jgi:hypothetical protein
MVELRRDDHDRRGGCPLDDAPDSEDAASRNLGVDENEPRPVKLGGFGCP